MAKGSFAARLGVALALAGCSSPSPATSSSSNWATCNAVSDCASVPGAVACTGGYCVDSNGARIESGGGTPPGPCNPLAPHELPVVLGTVLGVGKDAAGTIYMADEVPARSIDRVFVSEGSSLFRKRVIGSGSSGGGADADYTFTFEEGFDAATARAVLIQRRSGAVTAMALGPGGKGFIGDPGATTENLTVVGESAISGLTLRNLPGGVTIDHVGDVANGNVIVVTEPTDDATDADVRLYYGTETAMIERKVTQVVRTRSGGMDVAFTVDARQYTVHFTFEFVVTDAGGAGHVGPGTLDTGSGSVAVTERTPVPKTLAGFSFTCL